MILKKKNEIEHLGAGVGGLLLGNQIANLDID